MVRLVATPTLALLPAASPGPETGRVDGVAQPRPLESVLSSFVTGP